MFKLELSVADLAACDEILCLADTKLVLGGWHMITIANGRAIGDWNAICGMMQAHYGHARALYGYLSKFGLTRADAEWNRAADEIRSSDLLDKPPASWADLILSTYLVERAMATLLTAYAQDRAEPQLAGIAAKIGAETEFHFSYLQGWLKVLASSRPQELEQSAAARWGQMLQWWGPDAAEDALFSAGRRVVSRRQLRAQFLNDARNDAAACGFSLDLSTPAIAHWQPQSMRASREGLPASLFELIHFKHTELAMP